MCFRKTSTVFRLLSYGEDLGKKYIYIFFFFSPKDQIKPWGICVLSLRRIEEKVNVWRFYFWLLLLHALSNNKWMIQKTDTISHPPAIPVSLLKHSLLYIVSHCQPLLVIVLNWEHRACKLQDIPSRLRPEFCSPRDIQWDCLCLSYITHWNGERIWLLNYYPLTTSSILYTLNLG